jgi:hypothetical protein
MTLQEFSIQKYGLDRGTELNKLASKKLDICIQNIREKSSNQKKTLVNTILPRIAYYKCLQELDYSKDKAFNFINEYMKNVGEITNNKIRKIEKIPMFFILGGKSIYRNMLGNDNWIIEGIECSSRKIAFNIHKCLWFDACTENECPELCEVFCNVDLISYGNLKKMTFIRNGTMAKGSQYCDFCFIKN